MHYGHNPSEYFHSKCLHICLFLFLSKLDSCNSRVYMSSVSQQQTPQAPEFSNMTHSSGKQKTLGKYCSPVAHNEYKLAALCCRFFTGYFLYHSDFPTQYTLCCCYVPRIRTVTFGECMFTHSAFRLEFSPLCNASPAYTRII